MANPAPTINQINAFNATQGTTIDFNIIGGTELVRSNRIYIYDLSDNSLICTHLYVSTESIHELPPNTDGSIVYESGKSSADFVNGAQYYAQIQTFTDIAGTEGGSGLSVAKMFWCLNDPTLTIDTIPSTISTTSYNVSATYNANTSVVSNIIQQYQFSLYSATGSLLQSSGVVVGNGEQQGTSTAYDISYNFTGLSVGSSYYVAVDVTTTQGMSVSAQSSTFTVSIDTPTLGEATVVNNACDGYISVTSNLSSEYGGSGSGETVSFETDSENVFTKLQVTLSPTQSGSGTPSPSNVRPIYGVGGVNVNKSGKNLLDISTVTTSNTTNWEVDIENDVLTIKHNNTYTSGVPITKDMKLKAGTYCVSYVSSIAIVVDLYVNGSWNRMLHSGDTFTLNNDSTVFISFPNSTATTITYSDVQIELGSTPTDYAPYVDPTTISQDFNVSLTPTSKDTDPYLFKAVGDIYGDRLEEELVGGTVAWNQLSQNRNYTNTVTESGSGISFFFRLNSSPYTQFYAKYQSSAGLFTFIKKATATGLAEMIHNGNNTQMKFANNISVVENHYYLGSINFASLDASTVGGVVANDVQIFDLTQMFGSTIADYIYNLEQANAGAGVAWFKSYGFFTKPYYEYDAGTLKSVTPTAHKMVGVNQWDEITEKGGISAATGNNEANESTLRTKNYVPISDNEPYYIKIVNWGANSNIRTRFYDADKNYIGYNDRDGNSVIKNRTFYPPKNACYMRWAFVSDYGTTYNHDICLNISDPTINGQYFPYEEHTYPLASTTLRGKFDLVNGELKANGDIYPSSGQCSRKYIEVDLGAYDWELSSNGYFTATISGVKLPADVYHAPSMVCKYPAVEAYDLVYNTDGKYDKTASISASTGKTLIRDSSYNSASAFKTAMNGVMLVAEKATATTETLTPFTKIQEVSKYGTLEYITTNDIPVGHNTTYLTRDVFGGTLDLVSGRLTVTHKTILLDGTEDLWTEYPSYETQIGYLRNVFENAVPKYILQANWGISNYMQCVTNILSGTITAGQMSNSSANSGKNLYLTYPSGISSLSAWKTYLATHPLQLCYELATPLTYQLTPQQIQTLVGVNNVWSEQGDIELAYHIPITNLLVKRQDVDDVSGNWLTLYSQPVEQASDMDFTFIDFLNQYGKTYKYALVPLLTQTQSGVEVEVEGGYTVSDEVQSIFDGVFISDSTGSQKCKANVGYGNVNMNQSVGSITPIGSQYPIIVTNSNNRYHNGSISGMIVPDDYYYNGNLSRIDMVNKRNELEQFLTNKRAKIIKDWNSNIWLVMIMDNIDCSFDNNYGMGIVTFNANWLEVGDPTNQEDLQATGLVNVGGV